MANEIKLNLKNSAQMKLALSALSNNDIQRVTSAIAEVLQPEFDSKANQSALDNTNARIGDVENLQTTDKSSIVASINEIVTLKQDLFIVNATTTEDTYEIDKSYDELLEAINTNKQILVWVDGTVATSPVRMWTGNVSERKFVSLLFSHSGGLLIVRIYEDEIVETTDIAHASYEDISSIGESLDKLWDKVGFVDYLATTDKSSIVASINEIVDAKANQTDLEVLAETHNQDMAGVDTAMAIKQDLFLVDAIVLEVGLDKKLEYSFSISYDEFLSAIERNKQIIIRNNLDEIITPSIIGYDGEIISLIFSSFGKTIKVDIYPSGGTITEVMDLTEVGAIIGDMDTTISGVQKNKADKSYVDETIGSLENLQTTDKSNTVAAINELVGNMGDIDTALDNIIAIQNSLIGGDSV